MSYICILANRSGAVAAADTRLTKSNKFLPITYHTDHRQKVWKSTESKVVWALAGISKNGFRDLTKTMNKILRDDSVSFNTRLDTFRPKAAEMTAKYQKKFKKAAAVITLLYASYEKPDAPDVGYITVQNGCVAVDRKCSLPCAIQGGANAAYLSDINGFRPEDRYSARKLSMMAQRRVQEAIDYDAARKKTDRKYAATVGGKIMVRAVLVKK